MNKGFVLVVTLLLAMAAALPVQAQELQPAQQSIVSEVRLGIVAHDAHPGYLPFNVSQFRLDQIEDLNFEVLFRSPDLDVFRWIGAPRPSVGATINFDNQVSMAHLGLTWQAHILESPFFVEGTLGAAIHNGPLSGAIGRVRPQGCRVQIYSAASLGVDLTDKFTAMLTYEHMSNREMCSYNYGLSNLGIRIGAKFD